MKSSTISLRRRIAVLFVAFGLVGISATPAAATYCIKNADTSIVCIAP